MATASHLLGRPMPTNRLLLPFWPLAALALGELLDWRARLVLAAVVVGHEVAADEQADCAAGFCPRDGALGMEDTSLSPATTRMVGLSAAMVSLQEAAELMDKLAGVPVNAKQVERAAEALGREIAQDERSVVEPQPPLAREQGLCTSTGVVEAGCKTAIGTRLKRSGMHWTVPGWSVTSSHKPVVHPLTPHERLGRWP